MDLDPAAVEAAAKAIKGTREYRAGAYFGVPADAQEAYVAALVEAVWPVVARATADAIADKIEARRDLPENLATDAPPCEFAEDHNCHMVSRYTAYSLAAHITRSFGRTPETETTEAAE